MTTRIAHLASAPESKPETGLGACEYASGIQVCIGNRPALVPKPIAMNTKAIWISAWSNWSA